MSKYVDKLISMLDENPEQWCPLGDRKIVRNGSGSLLNRGVSYGLGQIQIDRQLGVSINRMEVPTTWLDMLRLRIAIRRWYKRVPLKTFEKTCMKP